MLVGMASEISKNYTYKCVDRSRHNGAAADVIIHGMNKIMLLGGEKLNDLPINFAYELLRKQYPFFYILEKKRS